MKQLLSILTFAFLFQLQAMANPVDVNTAKRTANDFLQSQRVTGAMLTDITGETPFNEFYIFSFNDGNGFIIVAADDCVTPILGFSATNGFRTDKMPAHIVHWLQGYEKEIAYWKEHHSPIAAISGKGHQRTMRTQAGPQNDAVSPLISTTWDQSPYYNNLCPYDSYAGDYAVTGCVATATAQIMKYWNHPTTGWGSNSYYEDDFGTLSANFGTTTYAWSSMPNALSASSTTAQVNAVATLMYHIGVAVEMDYSTEASSALNNHYSMEDASAELALKTYFKYDPAMHTVVQGDYSDAEWTALLKAELNNSRPVLYSGRDSTGGHSFVLDGYNNSDQFHINWGWGGWCDGYYTMGNLHPASGGTGGNSSYTFDLGNKAVIGIQPNNSWGNSSVITVTTNNSSLGTVSGGGNKSFGDTVSLYAQAASGCRFVQWSDGDRNNPRQFVATGGNMTLTATFEALSGDTLYYCSNGYLNSFGVGSGTTWGIKLPASVLTNGHNLKKVQLYIVQAGTYTLKVYSGTTEPTTMLVNTSVTATSANENCWNTLTLNNAIPVDGTQSLWIAFTNNDGGWPAAMTFNSGNEDSFLWDDDLYSLTPYYNYSCMIRAIFEQEGGVTPPPPMGDTLSYCGNNAYSSSVGVGNNITTIYWGIRIPSSQLAGRNSINDVLLYVPSTGNGTYNMNIYQGGTSAPQTLIHTQSYSFTTNLNAYQHCTPTAPVAIDSTQDLWITFSNIGVNYPASACDYTGNANSDFISLDGTTWNHAYGDYELEYSWMIRCITSSSSAAPTVSINGPQNLQPGQDGTFIAAASAGATITWSLPGATPSTATGDSVTAQWATNGVYTITATATTSAGSATATHTVTVEGCNIISTFPYTMGFESDENNQLECWTFIDNDGDGYGWTLQSIPYNGNNSIGSASYINNVGALTPDNWMITPQLQFTADNSYQLSWFTGIVDVNYYQEHYGVYVSTTGTSVSDFTLIQQYTINDTNWSYHTLDLSAYAGQNVYIAFRHYGCTDIYWMLIDDIAVTEQHGTPVNNYQVSFACTGNGSGSITSDDTDPNMLCGLNIDVAEGDSITILITPDNCSELEHFYLNNVDIVDGLEYYAYDAPTWIYTVKPVATTSIRAVFTKITYTVTTYAEPSYMGTVEGGGTYNCGATASLRAVPASNSYSFVRWSDNNTDNPRNVTVTDNLYFTAIFQSIEGIDEPGTQAALLAEIYPNPSDGIVNIAVDMPATVKVMDINGRQWYESSLACGNTKLDLSDTLKPGLYIIQIVTEYSITTKKIIVK